MENNSDVRLKKIPLGHLIDILMIIYDQGVDYIDIVGINNIEQDNLAIVYSKDYMTKDEDNDSSETNLSNDEDFNQLI